MNIIILAILLISISSISASHSDALEKAVLGDNSSHLWWMIQITDIHLSSFANYQSVKNFKQFVGEVLPTIQPHVVIVTGDITNAISSQGSYPLSGQQLSEWRRYRRIVEHFFSETAENKTIRYPVWLDTRGNHDSYDVPSFSHYQNLYSAYSFSNSSFFPITPRDRHFIYQFEVDKVSYGLVLVDAAPTPGLRGPFNFFGYLSAETLENMRTTDEMLKNNRLTIWASHYPTAAVLSGGSRQILGNVVRYGAVYLCGHYHILSSLLAPNCYARHYSGQLELELADFRKSMIYRVLAVDHGIMSFTDVTMGEWPVVLVTNPKPSAYVLLGYEPISKILESTHIRILAFSPFRLSYVRVSLNGKAIGNAKPCPHDNTLFTIPWNPSSLEMDAFHEVAVQAVDQRGNINAKTVIRFFVKPSAYWLSLHGIVLPKPGGFFAAIALLGSLANSLLGLFYCFTLFIAIAVFLLRCFNHLRTCLSLPPFANTSKSSLPIWSAERDLIFCFICFVLVYPTIGPWFVGMMLSGTYGVVFPMGVVLFDGRYIPEPSVAYAGIIYHIWFTIPVIFYFSLAGSRSPAASNRRCSYRRLTNRLFFALIIFFQLKRAYIISLAYGWLSFVTNILNVWIIALFIYVDIVFARRLNKFNWYAVRVFDI